MFLGASLLLFGTGIALAADDVRVTSNVVVDGVQQGRAVTVTVLDNMGPVIGANVIVKGTTNGNITDLDGNAQLQNVPANAVIVVSYIGYVTREISVGNQTSISVTISEDTQALEEVVVVGYGTQQRKDITGSVAVVDTEAIHETPVATFAEALQGRASGVYIQSSGAPGSDTQIRIRGVGTVNNAGPLIVVDGVSDVPMSSVNPNDIETLQILKDASATAIYGAQGANGVIIVTTKQGDKGGRVSVSYAGYAGFAKMANDGYDVLNGHEAMEFEALGQTNAWEQRGKKAGAHPQFGSIHDGGLTMPYAIIPAGLSKDQVISQFGSIENWEAAYRPTAAAAYARSAYAQMIEDGYSEAEARQGTDWYDAVVQTGFIQDHQISLLGGFDKGSYSVSVGFSTREGTLKSSFFDRYNLRANTTFNPNKYITIGQNTNLSVQESGGDRGDGGEGSVYAKTYTMQSWLPVYNIGGDFAGSRASMGGRDVTSAYVAYEQSLATSRNFRGQSTVFAEVKPIEGLTIRTQYGATLSGSWSNSFSPVTIMHNKEGRGNNSFNESASYSFGWQWTNTASYTRTFNEDHTMTVVVGSEALDQNQGRSVSATRINYDFEKDPNTWQINNGSSSSLSNSGSINSHTTMFGLFGRADYSYQGKYLVTATIRRDASSRFSEANRWGTFPSVSVGWRMSDEAFMEPTRSWLDDFKWRAGYGTTGNSNIDAYNWAYQYGTSNDYLYAIDGSDSGNSQGYHVTFLGDPNAKWETVKSLNVGFDATALGNKLNFSFEWYIRTTTDMLVDANFSSLAGNASKPKVNVGELENTGFDMSIGYRDRIGDLRYNVTANLSTYKNEVKDLGGNTLYSSTRLSNINITRVGDPIGMLYGYQVDGIYKSVEDVMNYTNDKGEKVLPYGVASWEALDPADFIGRYKMKDVDNSGAIGAGDRTIIGNPHPDFTGGLNIGLNYKNWDLSTYLYFSIGNDIFKMYEFYTHYGALQSNYSKARRDGSWHPVTNPNGKYPLWATTAEEGPEANNEPHSMYIEDGSYLRMQTLSLGYTIPTNIIRKIGLERLRVYAQISNVFTITDYTGLDPEIRGGSNNRSMGQDFGAYGMPRQVLFGVNLSF
jgi:TonB-linked SusC/RagA family outer membrane protein